MPYKQRGTIQPDQRSKQRRKPFDASMVPLPNSENSPLLGLPKVSSSSGVNGEAPLRDEDKGDESSFQPERIRRVSSNNPPAKTLRSSITEGLTNLSSNLSSRMGLGQSTETTDVLADEETLPPNTPLYGSSRAAANSIREEIRRQSIANGGTDVELPDDASTVSRARTLKEIEDDYYLKTQQGFVEDAINFAEGSIPQSIMIATVIGCVCGFVAYVYYFILDSLLEFVWKTLPEKYVIDVWPEKYYVAWIPLVSVILSACVGSSIYLLGEPGDLAFTIKSVHEKVSYDTRLIMGSLTDLLVKKGYKDPSYIIPMVVASLFSIVAGGSLGPEAPLVAICAALAGLISRSVFKQRNTNIVRKHTFMGMAGALAAFFGVPLGGSLFALEVASRFGVEYFEHSMEAIFAGLICVVAFRSLAGLELEQIWATQDSPTILHCEPSKILLGLVLGCVGGFLAFLWANFHWRLMGLFGRLGLLDDNNTRALPRALVGSIGIISIGMLIPHTMFWGEWEVPVLARMEPAVDLPHVWPTSGLIGFEMDTCAKCLITGFAKLIAISFTVAGGFRGGFIFPFFTAGAAFGRALCFVFPSISPAIATLCIAAGINVAITRTALATSMILSFLAGEQMALPPILSASIASLFVTSYMPFIKSQIARSDIDFTLYYKQSKPCGSVVSIESFMTSPHLGRGPPKAARSPGSSAPSF